ncbi:MAG: YIP1 family protein [Syntrophomonadaceae bacterium]
MTILDVLYGLIFQPQGTMCELARTRPLRTGLLVFLGVCMVNYLFQGASGQISPSAFGSNLLPLPFWLIGILGAITAVLMWFMSAGLFSLLGEVLYGYGNGKALLTCLSFAVFPGVLGPALHYAAVMINLKTVGVLLYLLSMLWVMVLQVLAVREALTLTTGQAILIYILPLATIIAFFVLLLLVGGMVLSSLPLS